MYRLLFLLFFIITIAALLRFLNLSPFTIYPDSYQNLLVAENIARYQSVVGFLGLGGMLYPDFFMWTRPVYALLINGVTFITHDSFLSARIIAYSLAVLAIPIAYFVYKTIFPEPSRRVSLNGLSAAALLALSYNHTIWSGLVMTETAGVFFLLLFLWSFFGRVKKKTELFNLLDLLCGILFAIAVLTRYEYIIILVPIIFLAYKLSPKPSLLLANILFALLLGLLLATFTLFPWQTVIPVILNQLLELVFRAGLIVVVFVVGFLSYRFLSKKHKAFILICITIFALYLLFFGHLPFLINFARHDILLTVFALIGLVMLLRNTKFRPYAYFSLMAILSLLFIYHRINPNMERYLTHIIPFLLIPASYALSNVLKIKNFKLKIFLLPLLIVTVIQLLQTANGLRYLKDPSWYRTSYEEKVAIEIQKKLPTLCHPELDSGSLDTRRANAEIPDHVRNDDTFCILLASMPEPYYYRLRLTTHSIADTPPFLHIPADMDHRSVLIIEDIGMRDIFPHFTKQLDTKLQKYKVAEFKVNEIYHTANVSKTEIKPVVLYKIKLEELRKLVK